MVLLKERDGHDDGAFPTPAGTAHKAGQGKAGLEVDGLCWLGHGRLPGMTAQGGEAEG